MPGTELPTFEPAYLLHVGDMPVPGERRIRAGGTLSYEGNCLSASFSPRTWQEVAYIDPDKPIWRLEHCEGRPLRLLDLTDTSPTFLLDPAYEKKADLCAFQAEVAAWGIETGLLRRKTWLSIRYPRTKKERDDDSRWQTMTVPDLDSAGRVLGMYKMTPDDVAPDGTPVVLTEDRLTGTRAMADKLLVPLFCVDRNSHLPMDMATMLWTEEFHHGVDGVWWAESYEFKNWAPRAGIFQRAVPFLDVALEAAAGWKMSMKQEMEILAEMLPDHPAVAMGSIPSGRGPR